MIKRFAAVAVVLVSTSPVLGDPAPVRVKAQAGISTRLAYHFTSQRDCKPAPAPEVRVTKPPAQGALIVTTAQVKTNRVAACPGLETGAQVLLYQAKPGFVGEDVVTYEMTPPNQPPQTITIRIEVSSRGDGGSSAGPSRI